MTPAALYVLLFVAPYGQRTTPHDPPPPLPLVQCEALAEKRNKEIRATYSPPRKTNSLIEYVCEGRTP